MFSTSQPHLLFTGLAGFARLCPGDQYEVSNMSCACRGWYGFIVIGVAAAAAAAVLISLVMKQQELC